jgi:hypothetical protein
MFFFFCTKNSLSTKIETFLSVFYFLFFKKGKKLATLVKLVSLYFLDFDGVHRIA